MFTHNEITITATAEQLGTTKEAIIAWIKENFEQLPDVVPLRDQVSGHVIGPTGFACYKQSETYTGLEWSIETIENDLIFIVYQMHSINRGSDQLIMFNKDIIKKIWEETESEEMKNAYYAPSNFKPKNPSLYCIAPPNWWKSNFDLVSEATSLDSYVYLNIKPWLANNPGMTPLDYPVIKLNGGEIIPSQHAEWFKERYSDLMRNFYAAKESIQLVETEIRHAARELEFLKEKRLKIFEGL